MPSHGTNLGFTSADLLEGFSRGACPFHGTCLDFTSLNWLMWFDSLPLLGPGGLAIFLFFVFFCVFFLREISKHQVSRQEESRISKSTYEKSTFTFGIEKSTKYTIVYYTQ